MLSRICFLLIWLHALSLLPAQTSQGPLNPGTLGNNNTTCPFAYGSVAHLAPAGNASSSNNSYASASHCDCCDTQTSCLYATNFGFSIPLTATITGIQADVERRRSSAAGGYIEDNGVMLIRGGTPVGSNLAQYGTNWPTTDTYTSYGGSTNLWGTTWTPADVNAPNFGLAFASISYTCGATMTSFVDHVRITVFYNNTLPAGVSDFRVQPGAAGLVFSWLLADSLHLSGLRLERADESGDFHTLADLPPGAAGWTQRQPVPGSHLYRLALLDANGGLTYSEVIRHACTDGVQWQREGDVLHVLCTEAGPYRLQCLGMDGRDMALNGMTAGDSGLHIPLAALPAGMYLFRLHSPAGTWMHREMVLH